MISPKYYVTPKYAAVRYSKNGEPFTTFVISDKIRGVGAPEKTYQIFTVIVWDQQLDLRESDRVYIDKIESISTGWYKGSPQITLNCKIHVEKATDPQFVSQPEEERFSPVPEVPKAPPVDFSNIDDVPLPFDL